MVALTSVLPGVVLVLILAWRLGAPSLGRMIDPPTPTTVPTAVPSPTPLPPTATPVPPTPTPTIDATEIMRRAAVVATLMAPPPTSTATPTPAPPKFVTEGGIYRRTDAPVTLVIPKIGVKASVESVGLDPTGALATPTTAFRVAWYDGGPLPGQPGNAVIDGHLDSRIYGEAVFWNLDKLVPGDKVEVEMPAKRTLTFVVQRVAVYAYNDAPLDEIFGDTDTPNLNLITCTGVFNRSNRNYDRRRVVYTRLEGA